MSKDDKSFSSSGINCEKPIYRNFLETVDNTGFLMSRFLHF